MKTAENLGAEIIIRQNTCDLWYTYVYRSIQAQENSHVLINLGENNSH